MTDSVAVFSPGDRLTDNATGAVLPGGVAYFYDAGTTTPRTVYADADLSTALGTSVTADALGYPTSDGSTKTLVYTGTAAYKVTMKDADGVDIVTHDNVKGAVETVDATDTSVIATSPVVVKSLDYTVLDTDQSKTIVLNTTGGDVILTLPSAATVGNGWAIIVEHAGTGNLGFLATVSSQTISLGPYSYGAQLAIRRGETLRLVSDGGNWRAAQATGQIINTGQGIIPVLDRLSAPPSPTDGAWYILTGSPSGDWSSYAEHDLVQYTGAAWVKISPYADCGWTAYVADENRYYRYVDSAWVRETDSLGATQSDMEAATSSNVYVTPDVLKYSQGQAKFWLLADVSAGTPSVTTSYNITSITDDGTGLLTVTIADDFSSSDWVCLGFCKSSGSPQHIGASERNATARTAGSIALESYQTDNAIADPVSWHVVGFGDQ